MVFAFVSIESLCLFIGAFSPLIFKVIIYRYVLTAILLIVSGFLSLLTLVSVFSFLFLCLWLDDYFNGIFRFLPALTVYIFYRILVCHYHDDNIIKWLHFPKNYIIILNIYWQLIFKKKHGAAPVKYTSW